LIRKGTRKKKLEMVQLWQCKSCERVFTPAPGALRNKTYPLRVIVDGISAYNLGFSLREVSAKLKARYGLRIPPSTLGSWLDEHKGLTSYARLRQAGRRLFPPSQIIRSVKLYHRQVYGFAYHRAKLQLLRESREHARFAGLADFLESVLKVCPHELFRDSSRASQIGADFIDQSKLVVLEKENFATRSAAFIIPAIGDNRLRHETLQRFMLANDSVTVAVEIPIWLYPKDIRAIEAEYGLRIFQAKEKAESITGHIDFLQVRNGAVHILDYKPDAKTNRPVAQLTIYALALSRLTGIRLFDIKCGWFNEHQYCEFLPRPLVSKGRRAKRP
jgi:hypothetical protein